MIPVLSALSGLYLRYVGNSKNNHHGEMTTNPVLSFESMMHNGAFLLSHLTNQG
jgi:hypothetical protein